MVYVCLPSQPVFQWILYVLCFSGAKDTGRIKTNYRDVQGWIELYLTVGGDNNIRLLLTVSYVKTIKINENEEYIEYSFNSGFEYKNQPR